MSPPAISLDPQLHSKLRGIVRAIVRANQHLIDHLPALGLEDLEQEGMLAALRAHVRYRLPHSYSSWIGRAVHARIIDVYRRENRRKQGRDRLTEGDYGKIEIREKEGENPQNLSLVQVVIRISVEVAGADSAVYPANSPRWHYPQMAALALLQGWLGLTDLAALRLLSVEPAYCLALGHENPPDYKAYHRFASSAAVVEMLPALRKRVKARLEQELCASQWQVAMSGLTGSGESLSQTESPTASGTGTLTCGPIV